MTLSQIFVSIYAIAAIGVSALAIWRVVTSSAANYKPLWVVGSLFGFVGFATSLNASSDLYLQFGVQIPVISIIWVSGGEGIVLKALFPLVAVVALVKFHSPSSDPS
ncbi:MAG: hypothetical protein ACK4SZ_11500 [Allosphingosinicella sp.]|uniref:hypothetical protein n=1 Tax=Allosphingosinicella sp. TaxID=2823234 RepID=UPI00392DEEDB